VKIFHLETVLNRKKPIRKSIEFKVITEIYYNIREGDPDYLPYYWTSHDLIPDHIPFKLWYKLI
jgi:hypothetical protein